MIWVVDIVQYRPHIVSNTQTAFTSELVTEHLVFQTAAAVMVTEAASRPLFSRLTVARPEAARQATPDTARTRGGTPAMAEP
jgi:hypothetical protein